MAIEIKAPAFPESVADGEIASWHKAEGDAVSRDELIVEIETDKVVMEVLAPEDGVIGKILAAEGATLADVVKVSVYVADMADFAAMNEAYAKFFPVDPPARITVGGAQLALGARVEIECVARVPSGG